MEIFCTPVPFQVGYSFQESGFISLYSNHYTGFIISFIILQIYSIINFYIAFSNARSSALLFSTMRLRTTNSDTSMSVTDHPGYFRANEISCRRQVDMTLEMKHRTPRHKQVMRTVALRSKPCQDVNGLLCTIEIRYL